MATSGTFSDGYLAGIIDGEGCVSVTMNKKLFTVVCVRVAMLDHEPVDLLYKRFGGYRSAASNLKRYTRPCHTWAVFGRAAIPALEFIKNNCVLKSKIATPCLEIARQECDVSRGHLSQADRELRVALLREARGANPARRREVDEARIAAYLAPKTNGRVIVASSNGMTYESMSEAANALGLSTSAISFAIRKNTKCNGVYWSRANGN